MIKVVIVDDHSVVREGVKRILADTEDISVVDEAANGNEAIKIVTNRDCDLLLLDLSLPDIGGFDVLRVIRDKKPTLPILILSMFPEEDYALRALKEGASGYLNKASMPDELIRAIHTTIRNRVFVSETLGEILVREKTGKTGRLIHDSLSEREFQIFRMIVSGKPIKAIARDLSIAPTTVSTYRSHILTKMNMTSNTELVRYALEHHLVE
jgi:two-component system, NarL family, invasion response regulator UvrY